MPDRLDLALLGKSVESPQGVHQAAACARLEELLFDIRAEAAGEIVGAAVMVAPQKAIQRCPPRRPKWIKATPSSSV